MYPIRQYVMMTQPDTHSETCDNDDCDEPTPWDMISIRLGEHSVCSPDCARALLDATNGSPMKVTLHDPQYVLDRDQFPGVAEDAVNIERRVTNRSDAIVAIDQLEQMLGDITFRV